MGVSNWHHSNYFALMGSKSPPLLAELVWLWQNTIHSDTWMAQYFGENLRKYIWKEKIIISLGSELLLLGIYAKEIFPKKKECGTCRWKIWDKCWNNEKLAITQGNYGGVPPSIFCLDHCHSLQLVALFPPLHLQSTLYSAVRVTFFKRKWNHFPTSPQNALTTLTAINSGWTTTSWTCIMAIAPNWSPFFHLLTVRTQWKWSLSNQSVKSLLCSESSSGFQSDSE